MLTNKEQARRCLALADEALQEDRGWEAANYWVARAQVYATLSAAEN